MRGFVQITFYKTRKNINDTLCGNFRLLRTGVDILIKQTFRYN